MNLNHSFFLNFRPIWHVRAIEKRFFERLLDDIQRMSFPNRFNLVLQSRVFFISCDDFIVATAHFRAG